MSVKATNWAYSHSIKPNHKFVLVAMADNADDAGVCWPGYRYVADKTCMSERTVMRIVADLCRFGLIEKETRRGADGRQKSNIYRLKLEQSPGDNLSCGQGDKLGIDRVTNRVSPGDNTVTPNNELTVIKSNHHNNHQQLSDDAVQDLALVDWIFDLIKILNPKHKPPNRNQWAKEIRLMREIDGRSRHDIAVLFKWANADQFWRGNILSPGKLRKNWDRLIIQKNLHVPGQVHAPPDYQCTFAGCKMHGVATHESKFYCREHLALKAR